MAHVSAAPVGLRDALLTSTVATIRRRPLLSFFVLAYAFAWWPTLLYLVGVQPPLPHFAAGPLLSALVVTALTGGRAGLKSLWQRMVLWRVGWRWWAIATLLPAGLVAVGVTLNYAFGAAFPTPDQLASWPMALVFFFLWFVLPVAAPLGEEPGWRGLAQPLLLKGWSAFAASLILGVVWAMWHLPLIVVWKVSDWALIPLVVPSAILMTWMYLNTRGSVLLAVAYHASFDATTNFVRDIGTAWNPTVSTLLLALPLWIAALVLVALTGSDLGSSTRQRIDTGDAQR